MASFCSWQVSATNAQTKFDKSPNVIYGDDNRKDVYESENASFRQLSSSTVALLENKSLSILPSGFYKIKGEQYGAAMGLCKSERFFEQPSAAFCSGSLIAPNLMMTAGHCIKDATDCKNTKFVFGFAVKSKGVTTTEIPPEDVVSCKRIVSRELNNSTQNDYAIIELQVPVTHRKPIKLSKVDPVVATSLLVIGHPSGLPTKITDGAKVRNVKSGAPYFVANLDTYGGNSGSAVFNSNTGVIEGILVRGETDFITRNGCHVSYVCASNDCRGEDVTKASSVRKALLAAGISIDGAVVKPPKPPKPPAPKPPTRKPPTRKPPHNPWDN
jgi:hypothetical protein